MDNIIIKKITILSLILGAIMGIFAPIPYVSMLILFTVLLLASPVVILYMIANGDYDLTTTKDIIIAGAITGLSVNLSFSLTYCALTAILAKCFGIYGNYFLNTMIINSPIWLLLTFIIFIGVLFATTNAFSGFLTYYIVNFIRDNYEKHKNKDEEWQNLHQK